MSYATVDDLRAYLPQTPVTGETDDLFESILGRATQIIDTELGYAFGTSALGTATVYGDGTDYLKPPAFVAGSITLVTAPSGYSVPSYVEQGGLLIVTRDGRIAPAYLGRSLTGLGYSPIGSWLPGVPYTVLATFGYATVPSDIVECCLELAVRIWRAKDAGFSDVVGIEGGGAVGYNGKYPALVKAILDRYKRADSVGVH